MLPKLLNYLAFQSFDFELHPPPSFRSKILIIKNLSKPGKRGITGIVFLMYLHGYHLEHLCGLRKSRSERQKVSARITVVVQVKHLRNWTYNIIILKF